MCSAQNPGEHLTFVRSTNTRGSKGVDSIQRVLQGQTQVMQEMRRRASLENGIYVSRKGPDSKLTLDAHGLVFDK